MTAFDTNLLVYAHREDAKFHAEANAALVKLAAGTEGWAVPWPCAHEFIAIVTHPKIYKTPSPLERALEALAELNACPTLEFIGEADGYLDSLAGIALAARLQGGAIHDARIAAICRFYGVRESVSSSAHIGWNWMELEVRMDATPNIAGLAITPEVLKFISGIDEFKGTWRAIGRIAPDRLSALRRVATIESAASSTRIEGAKLTDREVERLLSNLDIKSFTSRDEQKSPATPTPRRRSLLPGMLST